MTPIENYSLIIDGIFGVGTTTFDIQSRHKNNVIAALNDHSNFNTFSINFKARLNRIKHAYVSSPEYLKEILCMVNEVSSIKNWEGAFAELAVYDHFNHGIITQRGTLYQPIKTNVTLAPDLSFAGQLGKKQTNLDGWIEDFNLYFDVKCLKDNATEILNGIYSDLKKSLEVSNFNVIAEYATDMAYLGFQQKRNQLLDELKNCIDLNSTRQNISSKVIAGLSYNILWGGGVNQGITTYDPFKHAKELHGSIFNYTNKLLKDSPTLIVLVTFPWYNNLITSFIGANEAFYRAYARRVFCQYKYSDIKYNSIDPGFQSSETLNEISKHITGIVFVEDNTILSNDIEDTNCKTYVYLNPNAKNMIRFNSMSYNYLQEITNGMLDNFENDNY